MQRFKFGTEMEEGPRLHREHKTQVSGCGLGHVTQFRNFGTPLITYERKELSASNFVQTEDGACLCRDHKTTPKWAWPGSCDLISGPLNNFWMNWAICFKFGTEMEDGPRLRRAWHGSRDPTSKFLSPNNCWTNRAMRFKFGTEMEDGPRLHRQCTVFASLWALFSFALVLPSLFIHIQLPRFPWRIFRKKSLLGCWNVFQQLHN